MSPSFIPTIFPVGESKKKLDEKRRRLEKQRKVRQQRRLRQTESIEVNSSEHSSPEHSANHISKPELIEVEVGSFENSIVELIAKHSFQPEKPPEGSIGCQTDDSSNDYQTISYFFCNLTNLNGVCTAEVQVNIVPKLMADKSCESNIPTDIKIKQELCDPLKEHSEMMLCPGFQGITSLKIEDTHISLTGVTFAAFSLL